MWQVLFMFQSEYNAHLVWTFRIFPLKIINYNCSGHKFNIFLKYCRSLLKRSFQWYALYEIIFFFFFQKNSIDITFFKCLTFEIVCAQYKQGNSSLYFMFLLICQFIIECTDVDSFVAALDFGLLRYFIRFFWLLLVERLLIVHYWLIVIFHYYSFFVNSFNLTFLLLPSVNRKDGITD